jgi:hypothetical protein
MVHTTNRDKDNLMKEDEMGGACSTNGGEEESV